MTHSNTLQQETFTKLNIDFIKGMGKRDDQFIMILGIDKVFSTNELLHVQEAGSTEKPE